MALHALAAGGCVRPIRLRGTVRDIDAATGEILHDLDTEDTPDKAIYLPCGDRRASVCPRARRPTAPTPTSSSAPGSQAAKASLNPSPSTRACSPPSPPPPSARSTPASSPRREGRPVPPAPQSQLLPARAAHLLRAAAQRRRRVPGQAAVPGLLRLQRRRRLERPRPRAVAPHHHHHAPPPRQARQDPRRPGQAFLRQGRRVPAARADPLPRHLPPRRPRPHPSRAHRPAPPGHHRRRAGRGHPAGRDA